MLNTTEVSSISAGFDSQTKNLPFLNICCATKTKFSQGKTEGEDFVDYIRGKVAAMKEDILQWL